MACSELGRKWRTMERYQNVWEGKAYNNSYRKVPCLKFFFLFTTLKCSRLKMWIYLLKFYQSFKIEKWGPLVIFLSHFCWMYYDSPFCGFLSMSNETNRCEHVLQIKFLLIGISFDLFLSNLTENTCYCCDLKAFLLCPRAKERRHISNHLCLNCTKSHGIFLAMLFNHLILCQCWRRSAEEEINWSLLELFYCLDKDYMEHKGPTNDYKYLRLSTIFPLNSFNSSINIQCY